MVVIAENVPVSIVEDDRYFEVPLEVGAVVFLDQRRVRVVERTLVAGHPQGDTLAMLRALDSVLIEDSENEPPDFTVPGDDLGF
jgi:hypothetical protein